ncbi:MAG: DNA repair protein RecO [Cytophagales bacterium]|nr:DNA repair protein RecO [Cytophagales bacterium]
MLFKTKGIVLGYIKYKETSIIAKVYTEQFGLIPYIVNGVRSKRGKNKIALFQALTLLDLETYHREGKDIQRFSEAKCNPPFQSIPFEFMKSTVAMVLSELLSKCTPLYPDKAIFNFLHHSIIALDQMQENHENFLLIFLYKFTHVLGIVPDSFEDLLEQINQANIDFQHEENIDEILLFEQIESASYSQKIHATYLERRAMLQCLLAYYRVHYDNLGELKTLPILQEILH